MPRLFCLPLAILMAFPFGGMAQKTTKGVGLGILGMQLPDAYLERKSTLQPSDVDSLLRPANWAAGFSIHYNFLNRLYEFNADNSLMLVASPNFGIFVPTKKIDDPLASGLGDYGIPVFFQLPIMLQYANGMLSTNQSDRNNGFAFSLGVEATWYHDPWRYRDPNRPTSFHYDPFAESRFIAAPTLLFRPVAAIHWRTWSKLNQPYEFSLHYAAGRQTYDLGTVDRGFVRLSYTYYWNY